MKILVAGAGKVGLAAASVASRFGSVIVIEKDATNADVAQGIKGASVLRNDASNPKSLKYAIERFHPDVVVAAVNEDGLNIFISMMAKHIDPSIYTITTIRNSDYILDDSIPGVDSVIAPRQTTAFRIARCALLENSVSYTRINDHISAAVFRISKGSNLSGKYPMNISLKDGAITAIYRGDEVITSVYSAQIHDEDRILVVGSEDTLKTFNEIIGIDRKVRNITVVGAGELGVAVAQNILKSRRKNIVKVIDADMDRCNAAARVLRGAVVVNGPVNDPVFLRSENIDRADAVIAVSESEEENLLVCMNSFRFGIRKIISQYTTDEYGSLLKYSGIECAVGYHNVITNETSENLVTDDSTGDLSFVFDRPGEYLMMTTVDQNTPLLNKLIGDVYLPEGLRILAIVRGDDITYPDFMEQIKLNDRVVFYTSSYDPVVLSRVIGRPFTGI